MLLSDQILRCRILRYEIPVKLDIEKPDTDCANMRNQKLVEPKLPKILDDEKKLD